jgi:GNAT superfamily N-acetyltransferase
VHSFDVDNSPTRIDLDVVWGFLSTEAYWATWRTREDVATQVANAWRVVGGYEQTTGAMVGFARAVSDGVAFAYLADVFVLPQARGHGLAKRIVAEMVATPPADRLRWTLSTRDAHALYRPFGFAPPNDSWLVRPGSDA